MTVLSNKCVAEKEWMYFWTCPKCGRPWSIHSQQLKFFPEKCVYCGKYELTPEEIVKCQKREAFDIEED